MGKGGLEAYTIYRILFRLTSVSVGCADMKAYVTAQCLSPPAAPAADPARCGPAITGTGLRGQTGWLCIGVRTPSTNPVPLFSSAAHPAPAVPGKGKGRMAGGKQRHRDPGGPFLAVSRVSRIEWRQRQPRADRVLDGEGRRWPAPRPARSGRSGGDAVGRSARRAVGLRTLERI